METIKGAVNQESNSNGFGRRERGEKSLYLDNLIHIISLNTTSQELGIILFLFMKKAQFFLLYVLHTGLMSNTLLEFSVYHLLIVVSCKSLRI